jgi:hypothetical protein
MILFLYSLRSAVSAFTLVARRPGITQAGMATAVSNSATVAIVRGSMGLTP